MHKYVWSQHFFIHVKVQLFLLLLSFCPIYSFSTSIPFSLCKHFHLSFMPLLWCNRISRIQNVIRLKEFSFSRNIPYNILSKQECLSKMKFFLKKNKYEHRKINVKKYNQILVIINVLICFSFILLPYLLLLQATLSIKPITIYT